MNKFILISVTILAVLLAGCVNGNIRMPDEQMFSKTASFESLRSYMKIEYDCDVTIAVLLDERFIAAHEEASGAIDGSVFTRKVGDSTETCYLVYSPEDDLYFLAIHSSWRQKYDSSYGQQKAIVDEFDEALDFCIDKLGDRFVRSDVDLYSWDMLRPEPPDYSNPIYGESIPDIRQALNRYVKEVKEPFKVIARPADVYLSVEPCLNIYYKDGGRELNREAEKALLGMPHKKSITIRKRPDSDNTDEL